MSKKEQEINQQTERERRIEAGVAATWQSVQAVIEGDVASFVISEEDYLWSRPKRTLSEEAYEDYVVALRIKERVLKGLKMAPHNEAEMVEDWPEMGGINNIIYHYRTGFDNVIVERRVRIAADYLYLTGERYEVINVRPKSPLRKGCEGLHKWWQETFGVKHVQF